MDKAFTGLVMIFFFGHLLSFAMEGVQGVVTTTLNTDVGQTATTISVASTSGFPSSGNLIVREELISYTGKTSTTFTGLNRGLDDTAPAAHDAGDVVYSEAAGVLNNFLDFQTLDFSGNIFQQVGTLFTAGGRFFVFLGRLIIWDYSWFDQSVMGVPLVLLQYFFYAISAGLVWRLIQLFRGV